MAGKQSGSKLGLILIFGGVLIGGITLGGYYLSQNPGVLNRLLSGADSGPDYSAFDRKLRAPDSCVTVSAKVFARLCNRISELQPEGWRDGLTTDDQQCVAAAFADYDAVELRYHRESASDYSDEDAIGKVFGFGCQVVDLLSTHGKNPSDAQSALTQFYPLWKAEMTAQY